MPVQFQSPVGSIGSDIKHYCLFSTQLKQEPKFKSSKEKLLANRDSLMLKNKDSKYQLCVVAI